jgi:hypothetical protein
VLPEAITDKSDPALLLAHVQQVAGDWRHVGVLPRLLQARAMARLHLAPDALAILDSGGKDLHSQERLLRIDLLLRLSRTRRAGEELRALPARDLSPPERRRRARLEIEWTEQARGGDAALKLARHYRERFPHHEQLLQQYLALLAQQDPVGLEWLEFAEPLLQTEITFQTRLAILNQMQQYNRLGPVLEELLAHIDGPEPRSIALERAFHAAWFRQDAEILERLIERCLALPYPLSGPVRFAREREGIFPGLRRMTETAALWLEGWSPPKVPQATDHTEIAEIARLAGLTGQPERGVGWLRHLLGHYPFLVRARLALAELLSQAGAPSEARAELDIVLTEAPQLPRGYAVYYELLSQCPGTEAETERLLRRRRNRVKALRQPPGPDGLPPYDQESYEFELRRGALGKALLHRSGRPACHYLAAALGEAYPGLRRPVLIPGTRARKIGLMAWEGIADEVRMAQVYGLLEDRAGEIVISCEPRLETLLARSFPFVRFHSLRRRWTLLWQERPIMHEEIAERILSGYLDADYLAELRDCDHVFFPEEVMGQMELFQPGLWQSHLGRIRAGYLRPEPTRHAHWAAQFRGSGERPVVGLLWRSAVQSHSRNPNYLSLEEMLPLIRELPCTWVSLQPQLSPEERRLCEDHGILIPAELDLFDDMEGIAACCAALDLVVGISSLPFELAAAVGCPVWMLALTPAAQYKRQGTAGMDQLTVNGRVFAPRDLTLFADRNAMLGDLLEQIVGALKAFRSERRR